MVLCMKKLRKLFSVILVIAAIACLLFATILFFRYSQEDENTNTLLDELRPITENSLQPSVSSNIVSTESVSGTISVSESDSTTDTEPIPSEEPTRIPNPYAESYLANDDMVGWLIIPGTNVDYPVMWTPGDENYYLYRDFDEKDNANGCLILDTDSSLEPLTTNLIIHGHNMKSGAMFGNLTDFEDEEYFKEHSVITLHTRECVHNYEIVAVFRSQVYKKKDEVFKFYKFFQADTEEEFYDFYDNIKDLSLYDTGITAEFGDRFITLSTCVYHVENGRFVIVAKEIEPGDYYLPIE